MDEPTQPYHEIRALLADLVAFWPWDRPGTAFENAKVYLDFHCADCGAKLGVNDLAVVLEMEMLRLGTVDTRKVPPFDPICVRCYLRRAAPACHFATGTADNMMWDVARSDSAPGRTDKGSLPAPVYTTTVLTQRPPAPLDYAPSPHTAQPVLSRPQRPWWWRHAGECFLVVALLLTVLALGIALSTFPKQTHTSTLTRPTTPVVPTTAVPTPASDHSSLRGGSARPGAADPRAERLRSSILMEA